MTSRQLFAAIGNIDDRFIDEDSDESISTDKISKPHKNRAIYRYAGLAACAAVILLCVWAIPVLLNTPVEDNPNGTVSISSTDPHNGGQTDNITNLPSDSDTIIPGLPDEEWPTEPGEPTTPAQPAESNEAEPSGEIPHQIGFYGDYATLMELIALREQSEEVIERNIGELQESYFQHPNGYFVNFYSSINAEKRADLELILHLFQQPYYPVVQDAEPITIELYYIFYNIMGYDTPREDDVNDHWQMSFRYEIGDIVYSFGVSSTLSEVVMQQFDVNGYWELEPLLDENGIKVFSQTSTHPDAAFYNNGVAESAFVFGMDVRGMWVSAIVFGAEDMQSALDGILAFEFKPLMER